MSNNYISGKFDINSQELVSVIDDLPLWSAPFGMKLLDMVPLKPGMKVLDIGCGAGFPLIEIAQRLGSSCRVFGIDSWNKAIERAELKLKIQNIKNVKLIKGVAEDLPFKNNYFDLIISNNGINNVDDLEKVLSECSRTGKQNARFLFSMNLEETMKEFYDVFRDVLSDNNLTEESNKLKLHIYDKRKPVKYMKLLLKNSGFNILTIRYYKFNLRFLDGTTMLRHFLIRFGFIKSWKEILKQKDRHKIFKQIETRLNLISEKEKQFVLSVPFAVFDCLKK